MKAFTNYQNIYHLLRMITKDVHKILGDKLLGFYLMRSLTYNDFNPGRSDIDLFAVVSEPTTQKEKVALEQMHIRIEEEFREWHQRIESQYVPMRFFKHTLSPKTPRPYYGEGKFYPEAPYGNEWLINNYLLYKHGVTLYGKDFKDLLNPIDIEEVKIAYIRDLREEWEPKINNPDYLKNPHYQSYVVLNICRILFAVRNSELASKTKSAEWASSKFKQWQELINAARSWEYGEEMNYEQETRKFIHFAVDQVASV